MLHGRIEANTAFLKKQHVFAAQILLLPLFFTKPPSGICSGILVLSRYQEAGVFLQSAENSQQ